LNDEPGAMGSWPVSTVGEHFFVQLGKMLDAARNTGEMKAFLGNRAVQWGNINVAAAGTVPMTKTDQLRYRLRAGDLLVCEGGEVGRAAIWQGELNECYFQKALHRLRSRTGYDPRVLAGLLEYWANSNQFENFVTQTSIAHLPRRMLLRMPLPEIPATEQGRIAEVLVDMNSLIATLEHLIAKKQAIKQGMMQQLLTGKTRLPGFVQPWRTVQLGDVVQFGKGAGLPKSDIAVDGQLQCIHYGELFTYYDAEISEVVGRTDNSILPVRSTAMDVLMPTSDVTPRGLAKASAILASGVILGGDILVIRPDREQVFGPFLAHMIRHDANQVLKLVRGSTVFHLYAADMKNFTLVMPGIVEQEAISAALHEIQAELQSLSTRLEKVTGIKRGMMQELLTGRTRLVSAEDPA
jgi:type I restriction enzyme S subunit